MDEPRARHRTATINHAEQILADHDGDARRAADTAETAGDTDAANYLHALANIRDRQPADPFDNL